MKRNCSFLLLVLSVLTLFSCREEKNPWKLVWMDDFDGPVLDSTSWTRVSRGPSDWNNTMSLREDLAFFEDGQLVLRGVANPDTLSDPSRVLTAGVTTGGKRFFRQARFEIRARFNCVQGFWPALWLMPHRDSTTAGGDYAEIDIMEHLNADTLVYQTVHSAYSLNGHDMTPPHSTTATIDPKEWNVYATEIHPDSVCFYVNGTKTLTYPRIVNDIDPDRDQFPFSELPFFFILSNQVGGAWVGPVGEADLPTELRIDWVKVWEPSENRSDHENTSEKGQNL